MWRESWRHCGRSLDEAGVGHDALTQAGQQDPAVPARVGVAQDLGLGHQVRDISFSGTEMENIFSKDDLPN